MTPVMTSTFGRSVATIRLTNAVVCFQSGNTRAVGQRNLSIRFGASANDSFRLKDKKSRTGARPWFIRKRRGKVVAAAKHDRVGPNPSPLAERLSEFRARQ